MLSKDQEEVVELALATYGAPAQQLMAIGEIGELLTLFGKHAQGRATPENWHDELADVIIMMYAMSLVHGEEAVRDRIHFKIDRLITRIAEREARNQDARGV